MPKTDNLEVYTEDGTLLSPPRSPMSPPASPPEEYFADEYLRGLRDNTSPRSQGTMGGTTEQGTTPSAPSQHSPLPRRSAVGSVGSSHAALASAASGVPEPRAPTPPASEAGTQQQRCSRCEREDPPPEPPRRSRTPTPAAAGAGVRREDAVPPGAAGTAFVETGRSRTHDPPHAREFVVVVEGSRMVFAASPDHRVLAPPQGHGCPPCRYHPVQFFVVQPAELRYTTAWHEDPTQGHYNSHCHWCCANHAHHFGFH
ncbi:hypothetical protein F4780DRAFT_789729 [Xylariomycetidae sp. FL0641]|nr:hypothetical protein F4780DRAFT_789729 [Xylariomycetidae sp. FL0641]